MSIATANSRHRLGRARRARGGRGTRRPRAPRHRLRRAPDARASARAVRRRRRSRTSTRSAGPRPARARSSTSPRRRTTPASRAATPPDDGDNFLSELVPNNVVGPYQVMEAARTLEIPRVILASTGQVIDGHLRDGHTPGDDGRRSPRPRYLYACTKVFLEALGQVYARQHGIAVLAVRLGWCPRDAGQVEEIRAERTGAGRVPQPRRRGPVLRRRGGGGDAAALRGGLRDEPVHAQAALRPDAPTRELLGWEPRERWPEGIE